MEENNLNFNNQPEDILADIPKVEEDMNPVPDKVVYIPPITPPPVSNEETVLIEDDFPLENKEENLLADDTVADHIVDANKVSNEFETSQDEQVNTFTNDLENPQDCYTVPPVSPIYPAQNTPPTPPVQYYTPKPAKDPSVGGSKKGLKIFALILAAVILCIGSMSVGYFSASIVNGNNPIVEDDINPSTEITPDGNKNNNGDTSSFPITQDSRDGVKYDTVQNVAAKVSPSVVNITTYNPSTGKGGYASGIILSKDGYILTNDHIYASIPNAKFLITLNDGTEYKAKYVSGDTRSDIAILKITDKVKNLVPASFGKSSEIKVGETVLAIGQSSGLSGTVSEGIVSALNRRVKGSTSSYSERHIQTTAAINPGNSGGALVNMQGQVIGVTSSKYVDENVEGICFAIPIDSALKVVSELQKHGKVVSRAKLGITYSAIGTVAAEINKTPTGLYIQEISPESGLYGKGFTKGDIITHINGKIIKDDRTVLDFIENSKAGDILDLTIFVSSTAVSKSVDVKLVAAESGSSYSTNDDSSSGGSVFDVIPNPNNE